MERKDVEHFARLVSNHDLVENGSNISVSSYIVPEDTSEKIDIKELNAEIANIVAKEVDLRTKIDAIIKDLEG